MFEKLVKYFYNSLLSTIEAMRRNPDKCNNLIVSNTSSTLTPAQNLLLSHIEDYMDIILDEANRLYDMLLKHLTNTIMDNAANSPNPTL